MTNKYATRFYNTTIRSKLKGALELHCDVVVCCFLFDFFCFVVLGGGVGGGGGVGAVARVMTGYGSNKCLKAVAH